MKILRLVSNIPTFLDPPGNCRLRGIKEYKMILVLKLVLVALGTALAWLITGYTVEYFRPYKKK